jgi:hypothetical protein
MDDGFAGTTTINVAAGKYDEILPIIVPARTVVLGSELRSTTINAQGPIDALALDSTYTIAVLDRISSLIQSIIDGRALDLPKTAGNPLDAVILTEFRIVQGSADLTTLVEQPLLTDPQAALDIQDLIIDIESYINFFVIC